MAKPLASHHPIILYDGTCLLCSRCLQLVAVRDGGLFKFTPLTSPLGQNLAKQHGIDFANPHSVAVIVGAAAYTQAAAVGYILQRLRGLVWLGHLWQVLPAMFADGLYLLTARYRYRIFGRTMTCHPALRGRLME